MNRINLNTLKANWDESYLNNQNNILEPHEELVKFIARYKKDISNLAVNKPLAVDIGCGIGTQSIYLAKKGYRVEGFDISKVAIKKANHEIEKTKYEVNFNEINENNFFLPKCDLAIACGSLDSMSYENAQLWLKELANKLTKGGLFFCTLIGQRSSDDFVGEEKIDDSHERGTIQSYFDMDKIKDLILNNGFAFERIDLIKKENLYPKLKFRSNNRYSIVSRLL